MDDTPALSDLNGPFQLSEYLALKVKHDPHDVRSLVELPRGQSGDESQGSKWPGSDLVSQTTDDPYARGLAHPVVDI
jgi:hypothetical protein